MTTHPLKTTRVCFTIFDEDIVLNDIARLHAVYATGKLNFLIWQVEKAATGREHIQGYCEFKNPQFIGEHGTRSHGIKGIFRCNSIHIEVARGTAEENIAYVTKPDTRVRDGDRLGEPAVRNQGERTDIHRLYDVCRDQKSTIQDVWASGPAVLKYHRGALECWKQNHTPKQRKPCEILFCIGDTGIGKTTWAFFRYPELYNLPDEQARWFDGYAGQDTVLIDDFDGESIKITSLLKLLDIHPYQVPYKGGFHYLCARRWIITSNVDFDQWYAGALPEHRRSLARRKREYGRDVMPHEYEQMFREQEEYEALLRTEEGEEKKIE